MAQVYCTQLSDMQTFLKMIYARTEKNKISNWVDCTELRTCKTRNSIDNYIVSLDDELYAEVKMCIWQYLQASKCPEHFMLGVLNFMERCVHKDLNSNNIQNNLQSKYFYESDTVAKSTKVVIYDIIKLQKFIRHCVDEKLLYLSHNVSEEALISYADCAQRNLLKCSISNMCNTYAVGHIKNKLRKMEDAHVCLPRYSEMWQLSEKYSFYGVFDGHSGSLAATYAANNLPFILAQQFKQLKFCEGQSEIDFYRESFENAFLDTDKNFTKNQQTSGSTAVCALIRYNNLSMPVHLYVAWVGDSIAFLVSPTLRLQLVHPHKPDNMDERKRIEMLKTGDTIMFVQDQWRVNGIINISRSIGDYSIKALIAEPDFIDVPIQNSHHFVILGSDGFWDHVDDEQIVSTIYKMLADMHIKDINDIVKELIEMAKLGDSHDNITVVLVLLKERFQIISDFNTFTNSEKIICIS